MNKFKYTITKFDKDLKIIVVNFEDGGWAEIGLTTPLPKNIDELESIIKRFTAPIEAIQAQMNPDADISFINSLIGVEKETERLSINQNQVEMEIDPELENQIMQRENAEFEKKVSEVLFSLGIITQNPTEIPVFNQNA